MKLVILVKTVTSQGQNHQVVETKGTYCTVGREKAQVVLTDSKCSRQHAILYEEADGSLWIRDLESSNGTFLEDERIEKAPLKVGEEFRVGATRIEVLSFHPSENTPESKTKKHKKQKRAPEVAEDDGPTAAQKILNVVNRWPDNIACLPKEKQAEFSRFVNDDKKKAAGAISFRKPK